MGALEEKIAKRLLELGSYVSCAESCTGGLIAHRLTSVPGTSEWFHTGVVAYSEMSKHTMLKLGDHELASGLVTQECAEGMARQVARLSRANFSVATTGVCGPTPSEGHEPCTAWISVYAAGRVQSKLLKAMDLGRERNKEQVATAALELLLEMIGE